MKQKVNLVFMSFAANLFFYIYVIIFVNNDNYRLYDISGALFLFKYCLF